jgi:hypothetical protein
MYITCVNLHSILVSNLALALQVFKFLTAYLCLSLPELTGEASCEFAQLGDLGSNLGGQANISRAASLVIPGDPVMCCLELKLPTIWTDDKQSREEAERRERLEERRVEERRVRRKKMQLREKVGKSRNTVFFIVFPCFSTDLGLRRGEK